MTAQTVETVQTVEADRAGAPLHHEVNWSQIDWGQCHREVRRLQARIVKATQGGRWNKVKTLQRLLTHSFSGKASTAPVRTWRIRHQKWSLERLEPSEFESLTLGSEGAGHWRQ